MRRGRLRSVYLEHDAEPLLATERVTESNVAYIDGRPVFAHDAYFGGVFIEPIDVLHEHNAWLKSPPTGPAGR
ncbi:hypothetical protein [Jiangella gansuensis]|uniref:hypothetical protein n=1 Tax=Jiangella gansuensis TaxID=281473 RepID=UPI0004792ACF|nr:hypothetical protein [Jiangella gansuensis]